MKLVNTSQMREIEKQADANGLPYAEMMENAGRGLAEIVNDIAFDEDWEQALGLVGPGNNGGDTLIALTHLAEDGWHVCAYAVAGKRSKQDDLVARLLEAGGEVVFAENDKDFSALATHLESADILLDGLLGTGIKLPLKPQIAALLEQTLFILQDMDQPPYIIAVDCPSGVDCDSGEAAIECIPADLTVTMAAVKQGLLTSCPGFYPNVNSTHTKGRLVRRLSLLARSTIQVLHCSRPQRRTASGQGWSPWQYLNLYTPYSPGNFPRQPGSCFRMKQVLSQRKHPKYC